MGFGYSAISGTRVERGEQRTPWVQSLDVRVGVAYRVPPAQAVNLDLEVFNVLGFQTATRMAAVRNRPTSGVRRGHPSFRAAR
ncbi:hypothetical protein [Myxococcus landrumensis]|uniref:TonB-dependent receptor n=1 Tax=Myxococcus landrumensis TaxID=2813577 RepID=A0ABX7MXY6_9BACT|nr:hypothetical protein [Myxococcus landrumus]QSQ11208.1 hypothetical protein JY572_22585 [Myxococcus landrumus]